MESILNAFLWFLKVNAFDGPLRGVQKAETIAFLSYISFIGLVLLFSYLIWKNRYLRRSLNRQTEKVRIKTYELWNHGKKIVLVRRYKFE